MRGVKLTLGEEIARVEAWCRNGRSNRRAAAALGMRETSFGTWLSSHGYRTRPKQPRRRWTTSDVALMRQRAAEGRCCREVARELRRDPVTVYAMAEYHGIHFASRHRWTKGQRRVVAEQTDRLIAQLAQRTGLSASVVAAAIGKACIEYGRRAKAAKVADLGGMVVLTARQARSVGRAAGATSEKAVA